MSSEGDSKPDGGDSSVWRQSNPDQGPLSSVREAERWLAVAGNEGLLDSGGLTRAGQ